MSSGGHAGGVGCPHLWLLLSTLGKRPQRWPLGVSRYIAAAIAKHTYCTNWITEKGGTENSMERLSRQVGTSVAVLRETYVHVQFSDADWEHIRTLGSRANTKEHTR